MIESNQIRSLSPYADSSARYRHLVKVRPGGTAADVRRVRDTALAARLTPPVEQVAKSEWWPTRPDLHAPLLARFFAMNGTSPAALRSVALEPAAQIAGEMDEPLSRNPKLSPVPGFEAEAEL